MALLARFSSDFSLQNRVLTSSGYPPEKANKVENDQAYDNVFIGPEPVATGSRLTATHDSGHFLRSISSGNNYALWIQRC